MDIFNSGAVGGEKKASKWVRGMRNQSMRRRWCLWKVDTCQITFLVQRHNSLCSNHSSLCWNSQSLHLLWLFHLCQQQYLFGERYKVRQKVRVLGESPLGFQIVRYGNWVQVNCIINRSGDLSAHESVWLDTQVSVWGISIILLTWSLVWCVLQWLVCFSFACIICCLAVLWREKKLAQIWLDCWFSHMILWYWWGYWMGALFVVWGQNPTSKVRVDYLVIGMKAL